MNQNLITKTLGFSLLLSIAVAPITGHTQSKQDQNRGMAVSYPWVFKGGTPTARNTALSTTNEIGRKADYAMIAPDVAKAGWASTKFSAPSYGNLPSRARLRAYGQSLKANSVLYGQISWHTRSIWVNAGPKTISTATVDVYVMDVRTGRVTFKRTGVQGRSDERSSGYKIAAAILFTPLVTAVSGGPATPREQRAVQIALGKAYSKWVTTVTSK